MTSFCSKRLRASHELIKPPAFDSAFSSAVQMLSAIFSSIHADITAHTSRADVFQTREAAERRGRTTCRAVAFVYDICERRINRRVSSTQGRNGRPLHEKPETRRVATGLYAGSSCVKGKAQKNYYVRLGTSVQNDFIRSLPTMIKPSQKPPRI